MSTEILNTYPKYDSYKDSGIKELGKMPKNWELLSNKHIFSIKNVRVGKKSEDYDLLSLTLKGIVKRDMENPQGKFPAEFDTYQEVSSGDFVFCLFDVEETPRTVGLSEFDGMITGAYTVLEVSPSFDKNFIYYFYLNLDNEKMLKPLYRGLRNTIPKDWFMSYKTFVPTYEEQTAIARFLDQKILQIDQAISFKQRQIEKLSEYKQILIQNVVTKGLNPEAKMKDSGIEWVGYIPEHWDIKKTTHIFQSIGSGTTPSSSNPVYYGGSINWLQTGDLNDSVINSTSKKVTERAMRDYGTLKIYPKNSLVIALYGATIGKVGLLNIEATTNQACCVLSRISNKEIKYIYYFFLGAKDSLLQLSKGGGQPNISQNTIRNLRLTLPPMNEQINISKYLDIKCSEIVVLVGKYKTQIERLKEYKTILINQAVTGKIKVN